jgi:hypothetical protein
MTTHINTPALFQTMATDKPLKPSLLENSGSPTEPVRHNNHIKPSTAQKLRIQISSKLSTTTMRIKQLAQKQNIHIYHWGGSHFVAMIPMLHGIICPRNDSGKREIVL